MADPKGTIIFTTIGLPYYGFDVFSVHLDSNFSPLSEHRLTDGLSINFDAQFVDDDDNHTIVYISERTGSSKPYLSGPKFSRPEQLPFATSSHFHHRPIINNGCLFFISAHEQPEKPFNSWSALYSTDLNKKDINRLSPPGVVDFTPAVSRSGQFIAVASYGSRAWGGEFHELNTEITVFRVDEPSKRTVVCDHGGWPTWSGDSTVFFHRKSEDGWWSIFRLDLSPDFEISGCEHVPIRVTPSGIHCFTPAALQDGKRIAVATRRRGKTCRHIEIFDIESQTFYPITESLNPNFHHYNPFVSLDSKYIGYHRFRGETADGETTIPHLDTVVSPLNGVRMLRLNGSFPSVSPDGEFIAINLDFGKDPGLKIIRSDGSMRWNLITDRVAFSNSWSPTEKNVIYTSVGPIFGSVRAPVQIARITFDLSAVDGDGEDIPCDVKILTREDTGNNAFAACSPDGKSLVFRSGRSGYKNLYILDAVNGEFGGQNIRQLTEGNWTDTMPSWSPDGNLVAFSSNRHNPENPESFGIYVVNPDGTGVRRVCVAGKEGSKEVQMERLNHVCFSGDGEWLLFTANLGGVTAEPVGLPNQFQPYGDLHVVRLDGSGLRRLTWNGYENGTPTWFYGSEVEEGIDRRLCSGKEKDGVGDQLKGQFEEPIWISCDI